MSNAISCYFDTLLSMTGAMAAGGVIVSGVLVVFAFTTVLRYDKPWRVWFTVMAAVVSGSYIITISVNLFVRLYACIAS